MLDFKQQLQYAYLNERPKKFEEYIEGKINEINEIIKKLTTRNVFSLIIAMEYDKQSNGRDIEDTLRAAYHDTDEVIILRPDLKTDLYGYSRPEAMEALYNYYKNYNFVMYNKCIPLHFQICWESWIKEKVEPFTEAELLFDSLENELKRNNNDYNVYMDEIKTKLKSDIIKDIIGRNYEGAKLIFELRDYAGSGTNSPAPKYKEGECVYHIQADRLCKYPFDSFVIDISHYLQDIGLEVSCMKLHDTDRVYSIKVDWSKLVSKITN